MSIKDENCAVHFYSVPDGECTCPHVCSYCGLYYNIHKHTKEECIKILTARAQSLDKQIAEVKELERKHDKSSTE